VSDPSSLDAVDEQLAADIRKDYSDEDSVKDVVHRHYQVNDELLKSICAWWTEGQVTRDECLESFHDTEDGKLMKEDDTQWLRLRCYLRRNSTAQNPENEPTQEEQEGIWSFKAVKEAAKGRIHYQEVRDQPAILKAISLLWKNESVLNAKTLMSLFPHNVISYFTFRFTPGPQHQSTADIKWWVDCAIIPRRIGDKKIVPVYFTVLTAEWCPPTLATKSPRTEFDAQPVASKVIIARAISRGDSDAMKFCSVECPFSQDMLPH
jgi:hypothetical protein